MNWKAEAIEKLRRYDAMQQAVVNIPEEIQRLEIAATSIRGSRMDKIPVKEGGNGREEAMLNNIMYRQELEWSLQQAQSWIKSVDRALSALNPEEKLVIHRLYIYPARGNVERLCSTLGVEQSTVYRKRDKALRKFTLALYGFTETQFHSFITTQGGTT